MANFNFIIAVSICAGAASIVTYCLICLLLARTDENYLAVKHQARSNHEGSPRQLGGLAIGPVSIALGLILISFSTGLDISVAGLGAAMALMFAIGLVDDLIGLPVSVRLIAQFTAGILVLLAYPDLVAQLPAGLHVAGALIVIVAIAYWVNIVNFMDGLDLMVVAGLGVPMVFVSFASVLVAPFPQPAAIFGIVTAACLVGFAKHNWPPAKVFLGDSGSLFLGVVSAAVIIESMTHLPLAVALFPFLYFAGDASVTLVKRMIAGKRLFSAHSEHAYQIAFRAHGSRFKVIRDVTMINATLLVLAISGLVLNTMISQIVLLAIGAIVVFLGLNHLRSSAIAR